MQVSYKAQRCKNANFKSLQSSVGDPWHFGADPDPNPTPFFSDFKNAKQNFFHISFLQLTRRHINFCFKDKFCVKILFCQHYFSPLNTFMRKGKDPDPYILLTDRNPGRPKTCRSGSATLNYRGKHDVNRHGWMRSSRVVRASNCQCQSSNSPGQCSGSGFGIRCLFDPESGIRNRFLLDPGLGSWIPNPYFW